MSSVLDKPTRRRFRFSLRSLILLIASATGLWYRWEPWATLTRAVSTWISLAEG